jgi:hypothetical protein
MWWCDACFHYYALRRIRYARMQDQFIIQESYFPVGHHIMTLRHAAGAESVMLIMQELTRHSYHVQVPWHDRKS